MSPRRHRQCPLSASLGSENPKSHWRGDSDSGRIEGWEQAGFPREAAPEDCQGGQSRWQQRGDTSACDGRALAHTSASSALRGAGLMAEGWEIYSGMSPWLCWQGPEMLRGPFGGGGCPARPLCAALQVLSPRCPPAEAVTPGDSFMLRAASQHTALLHSSQLSGEGKFHLGRSCQPCPLPAPCSTPNPAGPSVQARRFSLPRGALPASGVTWATGMPRAVLDQHPSSGFISELLSTLSPVPPPSFPFFQSLGYIFLIILLPCTIWVTLPCHYPR